MKRLGRRASFLLATGILAVPLVATALAYGCTAVATMSASSASAAPGATVTVTGRYFGTHDGAADATNGMAELRLGSLTGPVLATAPPQGSDRSFTTKIKLPANTTPGQTFIAATQLTATGTRVYGTPARVAFTVTAPPPATAPAPPAPGTTVPPALTREEQPALTLAAARRHARMRVKMSRPAAKSIRARCSRLSRTSAKCKVSFRVGSKSLRRSVVVTSAQSSAW